MTVQTNSWVSEVENDRTERILDATVAALLLGGYEMVRVRDIAVIARMSTATIYKQFPSKIDLLVGVLNRALNRFDEYVGEAPGDDAEPFVGVGAALSRLIDIMERSGQVPEALSHAYSAAVYVAPVEAEVIRDQARDMLNRFMSRGAPANQNAQYTSVFVDVLGSEMRALVQGRTTYADMRNRLLTVVELVKAGQP